MESQRTMEDTKKTTERLVFDNKKRTGKRHSVFVGWFQFTYDYFLALIIAGRSRRRHQSTQHGSVTPPSECT